MKKIHRIILIIAGVIMAIAIVLLLIFYEKEDEELDLSSITIIGDSRMVGLCSRAWYKETNGTCIAKTSMGYRWFINTALDEVNKLEEGKKKYVVSNFGVNDLYNINNYIKKYQELATGDWKDIKHVVVSVNPTKGSYDRLNESINSFNKKLNNAVKDYPNIYYCEVNGYLRKYGFTTTDGLHYTNDTNKVIYERIKKCISKFN